MMLTRIKKVDSPSPEYPAAWCGELHFEKYFGSIPVLRLISLRLTISKR